MYITYPEISDGVFMSRIGSSHEMIMAEICSFCQSLESSPGQISVGFWVAAAINCADLEGFTVLVTERLCIHPCGKGCALDLLHIVKSRFSLEKELLDLDSMLICSCEELSIGIPV
jgi:hypothetical protein